MTKRECAIVSAYTGILCGNFSDFHEYVEEILNRPVWTHEFADVELWKKIKELSKKDFCNLGLGKENKDNKELYMKGKEIDLGPAEGKFDTVYVNIKDWNEIQKKLQALEIIKEKRVNVDNFIHRIKKDTDYKEYKRLCGLYKIIIFRGKDLTEEEYDLLKEVLL